MDAIIVKHNVATQFNLNPEYLIHREDFTTDLAPKQMEHHEGELLWRYTERFFQFRPIHNTTLGTLLELPLMPGTHTVKHGVESVSQGETLEQYLCRSPRWISLPFWLVIFGKSTLDATTTEPAEQYCTAMFGLIHK